MATTFKPGDLKARFAELEAARNRIISASGPIRQHRDALRAQQDALREQMRPLEAQIKSIEEPLYNIDMERSVIAKALGGRTG